MNEYDELMQDAASVNPYEQLLREQQNNDRTRMSITSREAAALPPEKSAEIIDISNKLKVPPSFVERNYDEFKKSKDVRVAEDFYDMALRHPAVQEWFTDKHKLAAAKDDLQNLSTIAWLLEAPKRSYQIGEAQVEFGNLRYRSIDGQLSVDEHKRLDDLRKAMQVDVGAESLGGKALTLSAQQLPMLFNSLAAGFKTGAPTAMLAGGVAAAAGPASPVTVPIATGAGYIAGQTAGAAEFSFRQEAGHAYEEFSRFKDENGQPLDPATARVAALAAGSINAGLDVAQLGILLRSIPGADKLASIPGRLVVKKALENQSTRQALIDFAKNYGGPLAAQAAIEVGQRAVTILAGEIGKATSGQKIEARDPGDILQDLAQEGAHALLGFSLIQAPGPLIQAGIDLKDAHNAKQRENFFLALGGTMEESKIRERVPAEMQQLIAKMVENGPVENVYVEPQVVQQYFQDKGIDPRVAMREVMGSAQPYEEALQTGHLLQIPTEQYASALAPTEHNVFFAKELRFAPDELNQREVEQIAKEAETQIKAEKEQAAQQQEVQTVGDAVKTMLEQTGQDPKTAETMAAQMGAFFDTMAERTGAKGGGFDLFKKYALDIVRRVTGKPEPQMAVDQTAFHGTPKVEPFDRFDARFMGTGEGAQVHGWGHYFARMKATAETRYRDRLSTPSIVDLEEMGYGTSLPAVLDDGNWMKALLKAKTPQERMDQVKEKRFRLNQSLQTAIAKLDHELSLSGLGSGDKVNQFKASPSLERAQNRVDFLQEGVNILDALLKKPDINVRKGGRIYTVDIKAHDQELMDLDKPVAPKTELARLQAKFDDLRNALETSTEVEQIGYLEEVTGLRADDGGQFYDPATDEYLPYNELALRRLSVEQLSQFLSMVQFPGMVDLRRWEKEGKRLTMEQKELIKIADQMEELEKKNSDRRADALDALTKKYHNWLKTEGLWEKYGTTSADELLAELGSYTEENWHTTGLDASRVDYWYQWLRNFTLDWERVSRLDYGVSDNPVAQAAEKAVSIVDPQMDAGWTMDGETTGRDVYKFMVQRIREAQGGDYPAAWDSIMGWVDQEGIELVSPWHSDAYPAEIASKILLSLGIKGVQYDGRLDGPSLVVFDDSLIEIQGYEQRDGELSQDVRGRMLKYGEYEYSIELYENADLSTFLHESGHFYLEVLRSLAKNNPSVAKDLDVLVKWMGAESADKIEREHHEKFARGIETYFMEGKAPSAELRSAFARFRAWLMGLYQKLTALNAQLNDDVRAVMDRMFATDAAIAAAQREAQVDPIFLSAEMAGMRPEEFQRYEELVRQASNSAREQLQARLAQQYKREQEAWWKAQRNIVRDEVLQEFAARNDVQATSILISGKLPDGSPIPEGIGPLKLARDSVVAAYGVATPKEPNVTEQLRRLGVYRGEGGVPLSVAAEILGYSSGDELVRAVLANANWRDQVEAEADARMKARYGDAMTDGTLHEMAQAAVQNDRRAELLHAELRALAKKRNEVAPFVQEEKNRQRAAMEQGLATVRGVPPLETFQRLAQARVNAMQLRNIRPHVFLVAARQAAVEAIDAAVKGDYQTAASAKQKELFNMELYRVAINAREEVDSGLDYIRGLNSPAARKRFGIAGDVYVQQISDLLTRFDFAPATAVDIQRRLSLAEFIERMEREGEPVEIDQRLKDDAFRKPYKLMTYEEFVGVRDSFKNIDHLARLKNKLLKAKGNRDLDKVVTALEANINDNAPEGKKRDALKERLPQSEAGRFVGSFFAAHRKLASMVRQLDGWKDNGPAWEYIMLPLNEASSREATMIHEAGLKLAELFKPYTSAADVAKNTATRLSMGLIESGMYKREYVPGIGASLSKMQRLMVALNTGNTDSRTKLLNGYGWNDSQLEEVLRPLTKADWDFVQGVWDFVNTYWPQIEAKQKRVTGIAPDKVEASPVTTQWGEYRGGYFPLMYDDRISPQAFAHRAAEAAQRTLHGAYTRGTTKRGHTIERVEGVKMPVRLDFGVIFEHVHNVIHDLAFHEALIDVNRVLGNRTVQKAVMSNYGDQMYKAMHDAVNDTAAGEIPAITAFEKATNWLRHGVTIAAMGWNLMTGLMQPLGISQSVVRVGAPWMFKGFSRWIGDAARMENSVKWIHEQSEFMRNRYYTLNREINDLRNRIYGGAGTSVVSDSYFWLITRFQLVADVPTWLGAYERYMEETGGDSERAIALADQAVLDSQGGGQVKDLADVQRHGPLMRLWTNFYSYFNVTYNLTAESLGKAKLTDPVSVVRAAWELLLLYTVPAVLGFAIKDGMKGGEDLDDEELVKALMAEQAAYILGTMVGFREFSSVMQGFYGYEGPAGTRFYSEGVNLVKQAGQGETDEAFWKALNGTAGILLHYPAGQVQRTIDGYVATQEGRGTPINMLSGKPRE